LPRGSVALPVCEFCPLRMATKKRIEVFIGRRQKAGRRRQQRKDFADRAAAATSPFGCRRAPCTGTGHVAAAAGGRQHVDIN
jgi:hypothetical protein